jgi:hypothetical protein
MTHEECLDDLDRIELGCQNLTGLLEVIYLMGELASTEYQQGDSAGPQKTLCRLSVLAEMTAAFLECEIDEMGVRTKDLIQEFKKKSLSTSKTLKGKARCQTPK